MQCDSRKVGIVGLGKVGISAAYACILRHVADELVLISRSKEKGEGEQLDLEHGLPFLEPTKITASDDFAALQGSDVIVVTAGVAQQPGQSRLDLIRENAKVFDELAEQLRPYVANSVVVVVSNPVDVLTYRLTQALGLPPGRVIGTGTMLDTARFRFHLGEVCNVHPRSIHAYVLGEHGDSSFPALSAATVGGQPLDQFPNYSQEAVSQAFMKTKEAAAKIIKAKGATYYAIGVVITQLVQTILKDQRSVLPISTPIQNYYGQSNVAMSVPCIVGRGGVEQILNIQLSNEEQALFIKSAQTIASYL
jgi:L-lactate dehydrogenase